MTLPTPYYKRDGATIYVGDCLDIMPRLEGPFGAVVTDPPYGMSWNTDSTRFTGGKSNHKRGDGKSNWGRVIGDETPFNPSPWLEFKRVVLWGSNHFASRLPGGTTLVWIKKHPHLFGTFLSDAELAWMKGGHGVYCYQKSFPPPTRMKEGGGKVLHPNQKPVGLMSWCFQKAKIPLNAVILDPFCGSGTTLVAAQNEGRRAVGIEISETYAAIAVERLRQRSIFQVIGLNA